MFLFDCTGTRVTRKARAQMALAALREAIPQPETELAYVNPYELIVAVALSAQCTDARVNKVTPALFARFPDVHSLSKVSPEEVFPFIRSVSYPNNKSKHLVGLAKMIVEHFDGRVPESIEQLVKLPGVGRKTAQVVASVAFDVDAIPVDTHVFRVSNRIGLTESASTPVKVERQLKAVLPREDWSEAHHLLILHGRYTCIARSPKCDTCTAAPVCRYFERLQALPDAIPNLNKKRGKYYCKTRRHYFDSPDEVSDRSGTVQLACPKCGSMNIFSTSTGQTTKRVQDYRV